MHQIYTCENRACIKFESKGRAQVTDVAARHGEKPRCPDCGAELKKA